MWSHLVAQLNLTFCDPMNCSSPVSSVNGILQARILELGCQFLLQGIFPTQGLNLCLLHWQADSSPLSHLQGLWLSLAFTEMMWNLDANPWPTLDAHMRWFPWLSEHSYTVPFRGQQRACLGLRSPTHDMTSGWRARIFLKCNNINYQLTLTHVWCMCAFISQEWYKD